MYIAYVDESGTPNPKDHENYVLSTFIVHEKDWKYFNESINLLKAKYFPNRDPMSIELHTKNIIRGLEEFRNQKLPLRLQLMDDIASLIASSNDTLISIIINKEKIYSHLKTKEWIESKGWILLWERIEKFLQNHQPNNGVDYGLITMDSIAPKPNERLRQKLVYLRRYGSFNYKTRYTLYSNYIIEDPYFVSSSNANLVQLADFVAWVTRRYYRSNKAVSQNEDKYKALFDKIYSKFDKSPTGKIKNFGIKIFP